MVYVKKKEQLVNTEVFNTIANKYQKEHESFLKTETYFDKLEWKYETETYILSDNDNKKVTLKKYVNTPESILHTQENLENIFKYNEELNKFKYNEFTKAKEFNGKAFDEDTQPADIRCWFRKTFKWCPKEDIKDTIQYMFNRNKYNPVIDYFESLEWDGVERLNNFMQTYYGVEDKELFKAYFTRWMIALVKRVYQPGCKFDNMLLIQGEQGKRKSSLFNWLGTINGINYYNVAPANIKDTQSLVYATKDKLIINFDDFDDICDKGNIGAIKEFITIQIDKTALKFEHAKEFPRRYVLCGTTNNHQFLSDDNTVDERRFWIIPIHSDVEEFDIPDEIKHQLYAEAVYKYKKDPEQKLWINEKELKNEEIEHQKKYKNAFTDPVAETIIDMFKREYVLVNGYFKNEEDFKTQLNTDNYKTNEFFDEDISNIKYLPTAWIRNYLGKGNHRSSQRIFQILFTNGFKVKKPKEGWDVPMRINGGIKRCISIE